MVSPRIFLPVAAFVATALQAQEVITKVAITEAAVAGVVRDVDGNPVPDAEVGIVRGERLQQFVVTGADGKFLLTGVAKAVVPLRIRRLGYAMQRLDVDTRLPSSAKLEIVLATAASELEEVMISGNDPGKLREFFAHRDQRASFGRFFMQHEIRKIGVTNPSDLFRSVPGIVISTASGGNTIRIRGCQPMVWVDGQRVPGAELDEVIHPSEIAAIEFYPSNAGIPAPYVERENRLCGSVLVWTRSQ